MTTPAAEKSPRLAAFQRHLRGAKRRLLWVFLALGIGSGLTWWFRKAIIILLLAPAGGGLSITGRPVFISPTEMLSFMVRLTMLGGMVLAFPMLVFQVSRFLSPLLNKRQRRFIAIFLPAGFVCYLTGVAFAYFVLLPTGMRFLMQFGTDIADPMIRITEYMDIALAMLFWLGVVFELPLVMFLLAKLRLVSHQRFKKLRRYMPAAALILSALITPTFDAVNQALVAAPIILLYETGVFLAWLARPRQRKAR